MSKIKQLMEEMFDDHNATRVIVKTLVDRIDPTVPSTEMEGKVLALYKSPFRREYKRIFDANDELIIDDSGDQAAMSHVHNWGRISQMGASEELQDAVGDLIAKALTLYWDLHAEENETDD